MKLILNSMAAASDNYRPRSRTWMTSCSEEAGCGVEEGTMQRIEQTAVRAPTAGPCLARSAVVHPWLELPMQAPWQHQEDPCSSPALASGLTLSICVVEKAPGKEAGKSRSHIWPSAATLNRRDLIRTQKLSLLPSIPLPIRCSSCNSSSGPITVPAFACLGQK